MGAAAGLWAVAWVCGSPDGVEDKNTRVCFMGV